MDPQSVKKQFLADVGHPWMAEEIFDAIPDSVFFVKDRNCRYVIVNEALVTRCRCSRKEDLIGKTASEVFPASLGDSFTGQDQEIIESGKGIHGQLELHLYPNGSKDWCLTWKEPVLNQANEIVGISGISRDLVSVADGSRDLDEVSEVLQHIRNHLHEVLRISDLAEKSGLSEFQLDQRIRALFGLSTAQYITRQRVDHACHLLERTDQAISFIALDCGYADQSAFTRLFKQSVGMTPGAFRDRKKFD